MTFHFGIVRLNAIYIFNKHSKGFSNPQKNLKKDAMENLKPVAQMSRFEVQDELEGQGFAVYDSEPTDELKDALKDHRYFEGGINEEESQN